MFTAESLCVEETLEAFSSVGVTAAWHIGIDVVVAHAWFAAATRCQRIAIVVVDAATASRCWKSKESVNGIIITTRYSLFLFPNFKYVLRAAGLDTLRPAGFQWA